MWRPFCAAMVLGSICWSVPSTKLVSHWILYASIASQLTHSNNMPCQHLTLQGHLYTPSGLEQASHTRTLEGKPGVPAGRRSWRAPQASRLSMLESFDMLHGVRE